jgi:hypothetical protein
MFDLQLAEQRHRKCKQHRAIEPELKAQHRCDASVRSIIHSYIHRDQCCLLLLLKQNMQNQMSVHAVSAAAAV